MMTIKMKRGRTYTEPFSLKIDKETDDLIMWAEQNGCDCPEMARDFLREGFKRLKLEIIKKREHVDDSVA